MYISLLLKKEKEEKKKKKRKETRKKKDNKSHTRTVLSTSELESIIYHVVRETERELEL